MFQDHASRDRRSVTEGGVRVREWFEPVLAILMEHAKMVSRTGQIGHSDVGLLAAAHHGRFRTGKRVDLLGSDVQDGWTLLHGNSLGAAVAARFQSGEWRTAAPLHGNSLSYMVMYG
jgi:hypothetical protein